MKRMLSGLNVNSLIIMLASGALCIMQGWVLEAVRKLPVIEIQINTFKEELNMMREELKEERKERKEADQESGSHIRLLEDRAARQP